MTVRSPTSTCPTYSCSSSSSADMSAQVDSFSFIIEEPFDGDYLVGLNMPFAGTITGITLMSQSGTGLSTVKIDSTNITGLVLNPISSTEATYLSTAANTFTAGQDIHFVLSGNALLLNLYITISFRRDGEGGSTLLVSNGDNIVGDNLTLTGNLTAGGTIAGAIFQGDGSQLTGISTVTSYDDLTDIPATFAPSAHVHPESEITGLVADLAAKQSLDSDLTSIAALTTAAFGRGGLEIASAASFRTYIGAGVGGGDALVGNPLSQFASTTSAQLKGVLSDELGDASGKVIFSLGTLAIASGKTLTSSNTLTLAGTDGSTLTVGTGGTLGTAAYTPASNYGVVASPLSQFASTTSAQLAGIMSNESGSGLLVFNDSPALTTPAITTGDTALGAGTVLNLGARYSVTLSAIRELTFSGTPANGGPLTVLRLTVTGGPHVLTIPTSSRIGESGTITEVSLPTGNHELSWQYADGKYWLADSGFIVQTGDVGTGLASIGMFSGTPTYDSDNLTGTTLPASIVASSLTSAAGGTFGTAAFTAATAYQASDADLTTWAGITPGAGVGTALAIATNAAGGFSPIDGTATLTNKTINLTSNTFTTTLAQLNTSVSDADVATLAGTETLTNKAITKRVNSMADGTSITPSPSYDLNTHVNTQATGTLTVATPGGSPTEGQGLIIRIKSTNAQTFAWNAIYRGSTDLPLPTVSSAASKTDYIAFYFNSVDTKWDIAGKSFGYT